MIILNTLFEISSISPIVPIGGYPSYQQKKPADKKEFSKEQLATSKFEKMLSREQQKLDLKV